MAITEIQQYEVMYSSNQFVPRIWLKNAGKYFGQLIFMPDGRALPQDAMSSGQANVHYHLADFKNALNLLQNEKPMYLLFNGPNAENGIKTTAEPVGEGEPQPVKAPR